MPGRGSDTGTVVVGLVLWSDLPCRRGAYLLAADISRVPGDVSVAEVRAAVRRAVREPALVGFEAGRQAHQELTVADVLTPREAMVFVHLSNEWSYAAIALAMKISVETVRTHAASVRRKLGVRSKHELAGMRLSSRLQKRGE